MFPKASLRGYSKSFSEVAGEEITLDTDIRTGMVNGYVIGTTSSVENDDDCFLHDKYWVADETVGFVSSDEINILTVTYDSIEKLREVVRRRNNLDEVHSGKSIIMKDAPEGFKNAFEDEKLHHKPDQDSLDEINRALKRRGESAFHSKRAFVKSALHCCHDDYSIAIACIELGIDKDSYTSSSIGFRGLMADLARFKPTSRYHSVYCYKGRQGRRRSLSNDGSLSNGHSLEENLEFMRQRIVDRKIARYSGEKRRINPRVIDPVAVSNVLMGSSKKATQQYLDSMAVFDYFIQPLTNVGARRYLFCF